LLLNSTRNPRPLGRGGCQLTEEIDLSKLSSNVIEIEWPPKSGKRTTILEIDTYKWLDLQEAKSVIFDSQISLIKDLKKRLNYITP